MTQQPVQEMNYKTTLNLPVTTFPMKAGAATREPEIEAFWEAHQIYWKAQGSKDKARKFILHDGPPYLSSDKIHIGTALNKILKDIVTRYKTQRGYYSPYVPGYDGHGLPIENAVVKSLKGGRQSVTPFELRKLCREFALKNLNGQEVNFKRLGVWGDWEHPYITIDGPYEAIQVKLFGEMYQKGYVYKGLKPVYWCSSCETALADAEVEYADHQSHSIYVKFPLQATEEASAVARDLAGAAMVIWTTTPWTLPANLALSVHPDFEYVVLDTEQQGRLVVAKGLLEALEKSLDLGPYQITESILGKDLEGLVAQHPFIQRDSIVLTGTHVTLEAGTGIVHTAPGHGMEDYEVVQHYNQTKRGKAQPLPVLSPMDHRGVLTPEAGDERLFGLFYEKANAMVLDILAEKGALLKASKFSHSYPHCWRCHQPVIYRATEQWFIGVDKFRKEALDAIKGVAWVPARGEARITSMVEGRSDWCISRQRVWGVPIPVFYCGNEACKQELLSTETIERVVGLFQEHTSDIWWQLSADEILQGDFSCLHCGGKSFTKEMDIMDVWFDSGVTHTAVVEARADELGHLPVELYLEGSDQHRGWFQSSLLTSVMLSGKAPYQSVLTHGFVLDEQGRKMSKSLGNVVEPQTIIQQYGADILRLWVASVDYTNDVRIGKEIVNQLAEVYKKVRNTIRYLLGNLADFDPAKDRVPYESLSFLDHYTLHRLSQILAEVTEAYDRYEFYRYYQIIQNFCVVDLSSFYFDVVKDTLYTHAKDSAVRRGVQTVLYDILTTLIPMLIPVTPHLAEDIWSHLPAHQRPKVNGEAPESVLLLPWPEAATHTQNAQVETEMKKLLAMRDLVNKTLEQPRSEGKIGSSLEAMVQVQPKTPELKALLQKTLPTLPLLFIISNVALTEGPGAHPPEELLGQLDDPEVALTAYRAPGQKCQRCWKYEESVGKIAQHLTLCYHCAEAVNALT